MAMKKLYSVGVFEECGGYIGVMAKNASEARRLAQEWVDDNGLGELSHITHRDTSIVDEPKVASKKDIRSGIINE